MSREVALPIALSATVSGAPPTEFRLFKRGPNETAKGTFVFDEAAARSVMTAYRRSGTDVMIDLEHQSLRDPAMSARADAPDARGWAKLELRNGELWAVGVTWTPDGSKRLRERTQRYISPAFTTDKEGRISELVNVALVAMPATYGAPPIAASKRSMISLELPLALRVELYKLKAALGITPSALGRGIYALAVKDPERLFKKIAEMLPSLGPEATVDQIMAALAEEASSLTAPSRDDPTAANAEAALSARRVAQLSDHERAECAKRGLSLEAYALKKATAVRRPTDYPSAQRGIKK
jgi:phage I-like protein